MKALVNSNPLVSALLKPHGPSSQKFQLWRAGAFELAISPEMLVELADVLRRPHIQRKYQVSEERIESYLKVLRDFAEIAPGTLTLEVIRDDPDDNHILAAAVETQAEHIVSGDKHLLDLREFRGIQIHTPREFLSILHESGSASADIEGV